VAPHRLDKLIEVVKFETLESGKDGIQKERQTAPDFLNFQAGGMPSRERSCVVKAF